MLANRTCYYYSKGTVQTLRNPSKGEGASKCDSPILIALKMVKKRDIRSKISGICVV